MSQRKFSETGINKKRFFLDLDSSDEEGPQKMNFSGQKPLYTNSKRPFRNKRISMTENEEESSDDLDLGEILGKPQKRVHRYSDHCIAYCHNHSIYSAKPAERVHFWLRKRNEPTPFGVSESKHKIKAFSEEEVNSEYAPEGLIENVKLLEVFNESNFGIEDYLNFNTFSADYFEQETVEDSSHIKDVKPYLLDSESEELGSEKFLEAFPNRLFIDQFRALGDRMIE